MISYEKIDGYNNKKCHDFFILNIKNEAMVILKKSNLDDKGVL